MWVLSLGLEDPLEMGMATHSSISAWEISWTEEPGRLQPIVLQRARHNWSDLAHTHAKSLLLPVGKPFRMFLLGSPFGCSVSFSSIAFEILLSLFCIDSLGLLLFILLLGLIVSLLARHDKSQTSPWSNKQELMWGPGKEKMGQKA